MNSGFYQLVIVLSRPHDIRVGRHGRFSFPEGYYVYTGSARRGLESRIARHFRRRKKMRWHIDHLLRYGQITSVRRYGNNRSECELSWKVEGLPSSRIIAPGFGSSDCNCSTHLFYFERSPVKALNRWSPSKTSRMPMVSAANAIEWSGQGERIGEGEPTQHDLISHFIRIPSNSRVT